MLFAPNASADVSAVMANVARAAACPAEPGRAAGGSKSFYALFRDTSGAIPAAECEEQARCVATDACWRRLLEGPNAKLVGYATEARLMYDAPDMSRRAAQILSGPACRCRSCDWSMTVVHHLWGAARSA